MGACDSSFCDCYAKRIVVPPVFDILPHKLNKNAVNSIEFLQYYRFVFFETPWFRNLYGI